MNPPSYTTLGSPLDSHAIAPAALLETRPMYWSIRRELWENRSIYVGPLAVGGVALLGSLINLIRLPHTMRELAAMEPAHQTIMLAHPYAHVAMLLLLTEFLIGVFYSLDALYGERRDRSILFWKSLPVSDRATVLAKASIPFVILPLLTFVIVVALQWITLLMGGIVLLANGAGAASMWARLPLVQMQLVLLYGLVVLVLWHAPIYAWFLLVSGWARRATFLWAVLPLVAIGVFENIAFRTSHFGSLMKDRLFGFATDAFAFHAPDSAPIDAHFIPLALLTPGRFLSSPGLWIGLVFAAMFLAAAVRLRRYREPI
jgi:ABC-2 type transport system permease protein